MKAFDEEAAAKEEPKTPAKPDSSVQAKQLSEAVKKGLLVDVSPERNTKDGGTGISPATLVSQPDVASPEKAQVDELDEYASKHDDEFFLDEEDSDDDLI